MRTATGGMTDRSELDARGAAGNPAISPTESDLRPEALRPRLAAGLPLTLRD